ncbi:ATP-dependent DNA ligase LigD phosphoesterase module / ATP-dependent DNA ligase LigD polymerase module [Novosphingobium aromaticivorans DSM 12444]|uniref:DNA ligase (ATP) n=1 Tax=Novosphingobium aromaticivorans (strain ATCC 700278 / DSM 12444 / CCUG 56034 / CIP 105152 / NBRC 16084 / F199) TaxID=279238 RepID=Q2G7N8_NOVAD|nr:DNA ligase D [Novosphingobium aromaticivorans]ABD26135.1 ATP-dependent DNA ligase LigD phosphoesterase module / ATP-dependent DNA ligase LigD polymerase module [Novosphingobium aromaticivorans DSM 12444]SCY58707.1 ATP-dependent DNA ligase LigD phosphoesterase module /ATP-dependent DNA ligase LigD polymerase module [Novosphingobium aromaticivorans]
MGRNDPLAAYNAKRDFARTAEPAGKRKSSATGNLFIVQKHDATRLHWDFRMEVDGVLKSWAVTRGPSPDPDDKRLAVQTEDHPLEYARFEGIIPEGEYGGGTVMLWDKGTWEPVEGKSAKDLEKGHLHFRLEGERMKGEWLLVRLKRRGNEKRDNWLLRKLDDAYAGQGDQLVERGLTSVLTGRTMAEIASDKAGSHSLKGKRGKAFASVMEEAGTHNRKVGKARGKAPSRARRNAPLPAFQPVQLATLVDTVPDGRQWLYEIKFDGYRALVAVRGTEVRVFTRSGLDWTEKFAPLARHLAGLKLPSCLIDGEIVAADADGNPDFSRLQAVLKRGHGEQGEGDALSFHAFDLLELEGEDLKPLPNVERKQKLAALLAGVSPPIHVADHIIGGGEKLLGALCGAGQEGIICKRADAAYAGKRTQNWLKVKCVARQEFIVVGFTRSSARRRPFASLLLAQREGKALVYKGKVGTGFDEDLLQDLATRFEALKVDEGPLDVPITEARGVTWLKPELVAEIAFAEFTAEGRVRHASFVGLREDKKAADVVPERPAPLVVQPEIVPISNRERVIFPESGQTKGDLADYYAAMAPAMLPFIANRPVSLVRCPQGRARHCFFQKHDSGSFGEHVHHVPIREKDGNEEEYLFVSDAAGILSCVQMGTIEFHGWCSLASDVEAPERMVIDLDPDEGLDFNDVKRAARDIRDRLSDLGLVSFAMLSGGKGVHVVVPLRPDHTWEAHASFAERFARALALAEPDRYVATMSKARRKGRIFIDWLRNRRGSTAVMPYSARARANAPVAVPIAWEELDDFANAHPFCIGDTAGLLKRSEGKSLRGWGMAQQSLPDV